MPASSPSGADPAADLAADTTAAVPGTADPATNALPDVVLQAVPMPQDHGPGPRIDAMAAFRGGLYLGFGPSPGTSTGTSPAAAAPSGRAASLWRLDAAGDVWQAVLEQGGQPVRTRRREILPHVPPPGFPSGSLPGQDAGFVSMAVFQGTDDAAPCLYVATQGLTGARLLRSADGRNFAPVLSVPASSGYLGLAALTVWNGRLVMTTAAHLPDRDAQTGWAAQTPKATGPAPLPRGSVLGSRNPLAPDQWEVLSPPGFGDPRNLAVSALTVHQGRLCAATANPTTGFQIWISGADGGAPKPGHGGDPGWTCLLDKGAARYGMNPRVGFLQSHQGQLWIGTAMDMPSLADLDWPAAEVLRIEPDGTWELIAGEVRLTPQGLRLPLSLRGPGLDDPGVTCLNAMAVLDADVGPGGLMLLGGGPLAGLWQSRDGETWEPLEPEYPDETEAADRSGDADGDEGGDWADGEAGVTAMVLDEDRLWIAMDGRLFRLGLAG